MKLRNKVLLAVTLVWAVFAGIVYLGSHYFLINSFLALEHDRANRDLARVDQALNQNLNSLYTFTSDWAHWNDLYNYMQGRNPQFIANNLTMAAYVNATINLLTYWDLAGNLMVGAAIDTNKKELIPYPKGLTQYIYPGSPILNRKNVNHDLKGFILLPDGIMMVAAVAITDGEKVKLPLGTMITGRFISHRIIERIQDITKLQLELFNANEIAANADLKKVFQRTSQSDAGHFSEPLNYQTLNAYSLIRDINDKPIGMFKMTEPRSIFLTGKNSVSYFFISFIILGIIFAILMSWLLRHLIVSRLEKLDKDVAEISANNELARRVDESGNDELSSVSAQINTMLGTLQSAQAKLQFRVEERTKELQMTNTQLQHEIAERQTIENELIKHKESLARIAHYDILTALPNRVLFNEMLDTKLKNADIEQDKFAVLFVNLDRFKTINALGHHIGDIALKEISQRIVTVLGGDNIVARLGGDEFIILVSEGADKEMINAYANEILEACCSKILIEPNECYISASVGISLYPDDGQSLEDLQKNADMAMYKAKRSGGNNYQYYTEEMNIEASERIRLDAELRQAINKNELILFYQPKVDVQSGKIMGVEALVRWNHPELGVVNPDKFIQLAEETGTILNIGEWVLREACRTNKAWQEKGYQAISIAVNISAKQFATQDVELMVANVLSETGLEPKYLELEVTESAVMENVEVAAKKLNAVKAMGVKLSIDDFGTGYTSINYLKQFPVNFLKIDQNFVKGIPANKNDLSIIVAMISLAHSMGMEIIAEGVETAEQFAWLADHDCDIVQGYFLSRPLPESEVISELITAYGLEKSIASIYQ